MGPEVPAGLLGVDVVLEEPLDDESPEDEDDDEPDDEAPEEEDEPDEDSAPTLADFVLRESVR